MARLVAAGWPYLRIERERGVTQGTLRSWFGPSSVSRGVEYANIERARIAQERYQEAVRLRMKEGLTNAQIAERVGMSESRVYAQLGRTPVRLGGTRPPAPDELKERARYLRVEFGLTIAEVADRLDRPRSTVGEWIDGLVNERECECRWCQTTFVHLLVGNPAAFCVDNYRSCYNAMKHWTYLQQTRGPAVAAEYRERKLRAQGRGDVERDFDPFGS